MTWILRYHKELQKEVQVRVGLGIELKKEGWQDDQFGGWGNI